MATLVRRVLDRLGRRRLLGALAAVALAGVGALSVLSVTGAVGTYDVSAQFADAQGLFPGAAVRLLGVRVGTVTEVQVQPARVDVTLQISSSIRLSAATRAQLVAPLLLGQPDIELAPGYTGGAALPAGTTIPLSRTEVPVSTNELLRQLERVLGAVPASSAHALVSNLAADLSGQGPALSQLVHHAAGVLSLLAANGTSLGQLEGTLAQLTGTLHAHEAELVGLIQSYDTVASVLASHQQQLGGAIDELALASRRLAGLLSPNLAPLEQDLAVLTTAGRTLDRNFGNLNTLLVSSRSLFAAAKRAYVPADHWLNLNNSLAPGMTGAVVDGLVRDRLAGVCRRILANHSAGLSVTERATLRSCGNPASGFFDPVMGTIQRVLDALPGGTGAAPPSLSSLLGPGLAKIPGLSAAERSSLAKKAASPTAPKPAKRPAPGSGPGAGQPGSSSTTSSPSDPVDQVINGILGPLPPLAGPTQTGGGGGLLGAVSGLSGLSRLFEELLGHTYAGGAR